MSEKNDKCKCEKALERAEAVRRFEIELYWKRSAYFWAFTALAFAGYGSLQVHYSYKLKGLDFLLANMGFVASAAWFLVNKGSKYWQEQWETKVDKFENCVTGPLYKLVITRCKKGNSHWQRLRQWATEPCAFSASKINQMGSLYVAIVWVILGVRSLPIPKFLIPQCCSAIDCDAVVVVVLTLVTVFCAFRSWGRTELTNYCYTERTRKATLVGHGSNSGKCRKKTSQSC